MRVPTLNGAKHAHALEMAKGESSSRLHQSAVWWAGVSLLGLLIASAIGSGRIREFYFISDMLYLPTLVADLTQWHGALRDWRLTPAPYIFPDLFFYLLARATSSRLEVTQYLAGALQLFATLIAARHVLRLSPSQPVRERAGIVAWCFAGVVVVLYGKLPDAAPWFVVSLHGGAALVALVAYALLVTPTRHQALVGIALFVLCLGASASDPLFVVGFVGPVAVVAAAALVPQTASLSRSTLRSVAVAFTGPTACFAGSMLGTILIRTFRKETTGRYLHPRLQTAGRAWDALVMDVTRDASSSYALLFSLTAVSVWSLFSPRSRSDPQQRQLAALGVLSAAFTLLATLLTGRYQQGCFRYFAIALTLNIVSFAYVLCRVLSARVFRAAAVLGVLLSAIHSVMARDQWLHGQYTSAVRDSAACLSQVSRREGVTRVLSEYWYEKPLNLFGAMSPVVLAIDDADLQPRWWINNRSWYRRPGEFGVVIANGLPEERITQKFGSPGEVVTCDDMRLLVYRGEARDRLAKWVHDGAQRMRGQ
jgi:hypothetical protein